MPPSDPRIQYPSSSRNQSDLSPSLDRTSPAGSVTVPAVPLIVTVVARPPQSPRPLRPVMLKAERWPICGHAASMAATCTPAVHSWLGLAPTASPSSGTAGKMPPAVHPPVDDEYSLRDVEPSLATRTCPRVSATARSVLGSSSWVKVGPCCRATPPYTWQSVELQVCATLNRPLPPLS